MQRLAALGDAGTACGFLSHCLATAAARLPPATQAEVLRQFIRTFAAWTEARRTSALAAAGRAAEKARRADPSLPAPDAGILAATALADAHRATELASAGLPAVVDASVEVASWGNAWGAAAAVAFVAAAQTSERPRAAALSKALLDRAVPTAAGQSPPPALALAVLELDADARAGPGAVAAGAPDWRTLAVEAGLAAPAEAPSASVVAAGAAGGGRAALRPALASAFWAGDLAAEGPAALPSASAATAPTASEPQLYGQSNARRSAALAWAALEEATLRDIKLLERAAAPQGQLMRQPSSAAVLAGAATPRTPMSPAATPAAAAGAGNPGPSSGPGDWRRVAREIAVGLEDAAEAAEGTHAGDEAAPSWLLASRPALAASGGSRPGDDADGDLLLTGSGSGSGNGLALLYEACAETGALVRRPAAATPATPAPARPGATAAAGALRALPQHPAAAVSRRVDRLAGEFFAVSLSFSNPLAVELPLHRVHLVPQWGGGSEGHDAGAGAPASPALAGDSLWGAGGSSRAALHPLVQVDGLQSLAVSLVLGPGETRTVRILARPLRAGALSIRAVAWGIAGLVRCRHDFELKGPLLQDTRANKAASARAIDRRLEAAVAAPDAAPWLGLRIEGLLRCSGPGDAGSSADAAAASSAAPGAPLPLPSFSDGEVREVRVCVTNHGAAPAVPFGESVDGAAAGDGGAGLLALLRWHGKGCLQLAVADSGATGAEAFPLAGRSTWLPADGIDGTLLRLSLASACSVLSATGEAVWGPGSPPLAALAPGCTAVWTGLLRASQPGAHTLRAALWYVGGPTPGVRAAPGAPPLPLSRHFAAVASLRRAARLCVRVAVLPGLVVRASAEPGAVAGDYRLRVCVRHAGAWPPPGAASAVGPEGAIPLPVDLAGISIVSNVWRATLVAAEDSPAPGDCHSPTLDGSAPLAFPWPAAFPCGPPLPYGASRELVYELSPGPGHAHPTLLLTEGGHPALLRVQQQQQQQQTPEGGGGASDAGSADPASTAALSRLLTDSLVATGGASVTGGGGQAEPLPLPGVLALLRLVRSQAALTAAVHEERVGERSRRRAAAAADALPPTLKSIAAVRNAAVAAADASSGGSGEAEGTPAGRQLLLCDAAPPTSAAALSGGRHHVHVVVRWARWPTLAAAMSDGLVEDGGEGGAVTSSLGAARPRQHAGFLAALGVRTGAGRGTRTNTAVARPAEAAAGTWSSSSSLWEPPNLQAPPPATSMRAAGNGPSSATAAAPVAAPPPPPVSAAAAAIAAITGLAPSAAQQQGGSSSISVPPPSRAAAASAAAAAPAAPLPPAVVLTLHAGAPEQVVPVLSAGVDAPPPASDSGSGGSGSSSRTWWRVPLVATLFSAEPAYAAPASLALEVRLPPCVSPSSSCHAPPPVPSSRSSAPAGARRCYAPLRADMGGALRPRPSAPPGSGAPRRSAPHRLRRRRRGRVWRRARCRPVGRSGVCDSGSRGASGAGRGPLRGVATHPVASSHERGGDRAVLAWRHHRKGIQVGDTVLVGLARAGFNRPGHPTLVHVLSST